MSVDFRVLFVAFEGVVMIVDLQKLHMEERRYDG